LHVKHPGHRAGTTTLTQQRKKGAGTMMSFAKITAGTGYLYLIRHTALGDADPASKHDAAAYYAAQGNPPGHWTGRGAPLLGLTDQQVTEDQMRALFGLGAHPDMDAIVTAYIDAHRRPWMTGPRWDHLVDDAIRHATLGRQFPRYRQLPPFDDRVRARLDVIRADTHRDPTEAETRRVKAQEARHQRDAVAGYDLVFSPVKSAALLWAVDPRPHVREAIRSAHLAAKDAALTLLEEHAAFTRTGTDGIAQIPAKGLIAAEFEHWDSRAGDPNLHTHVAISSKVMGTDGIWRALDARPLHAAAVAISETYNTMFEAELTARLAVTFTPRPGTGTDKQPVREITGVPLAMTEHFSRRRAAIDARYAELERAYRHEHGHDPAPGVACKLARQANLETREGKKPPAPLEDKRAAWREELTARFGPQAINQLMKVVPAHPATEVPAAFPSPEDLNAISERALAQLSTRRSTWTAWNVRAEIERQLRATLPALPPASHPATAETLTAMVLTKSVRIDPPALLNEPPELRRPDGDPVFTQHAASRYTSQLLLDAETRLISAARTPTAAGLSGPSVATALEGFEARTATNLDPGQRHLVTVFAADSRLLLAGIGPAGTGKTTAMRALAHVLRQGGRHLIPLATSAAAADVLARELGTRAENLHKFLHEWTAGPFATRLQAGHPVPANARRYQLGPGDVILVDEAGMAGTLQLDQLTTYAKSRGAVVRLLGDDHQLPAVASGGALRLIAATPGTPHLTALYRFQNPEEAAATLQLRVRDPAAIDWYHHHNRIKSGSRQAMTQSAYQSWKTDMLAGKVTLMAAQTGTDVTALSTRARADRVTAGQVEPTGAPLRDGTQAGQGDWIVTRQNNRRLTTPSATEWVKNGDTWAVTHRHQDGSLTVTSHTHGTQLTLPAPYVRDHVQLLYATTAHRAQGTTVDTAHPLITNTMTSEALYVLATRAREHTTLYVATHDHPTDEHAEVNTTRHDPHQYEAREILLNILTNESVGLSATEAIATAQDGAESLATLIPEYLHAARLYAVTRNPANKTPDQTTSAPPQHPTAVGALPWAPSPPAAATSGDQLASYLNESFALISTRVAQLAETVISAPPAWLTSLGTPPEEPEHRAAWQASVTIIAAYRDQHRITTDDPRHPLGPHPDPANSGYHAHQHATQAIRIARHLSNSEPEQSVTLHADNPTSAVSRHPREPQRVDRGRGTENQKLQQSRQALLPPWQAARSQQTGRLDARPRL
jgi:conjugative relaxase-like TrwC/TraI family protein